MIKSKFITRVAKILQDRSYVLAMSEEELKHEIITEMIAQKKQAKANNIELFIYLSKLNFVERSSIETDIYNSIRGLSLIDKLIADSDITEIMINGYQNIFIEKKGVLTRYPETFESTEKLLNVITKFVSKAGRSVNTSNPIVDARLSDGSRVNVVLPPVAINGPIVTIRKFPDKPIAIKQLIKYGSITEQAAQFLELLVKAKYNIFICGGTGSGKTTFLNALSNFIPTNERIITIEDSAELQIRSIENLVKLEVRSNNAGNVTQISIKDLIKTSLRMRPERIIVGEVRGEEALDMLQAMNTGHDGSLSTGHSNSAIDMFSRLETMVLSGAANLPLTAIRQQMVSAIDIIVFLSRFRDHSRKVVEISEVVGLKNNNIELLPLYRYVENIELSSNDKVVGSLCKTKNKLVHTNKLKKVGLYNEVN
ncbi:CpaF family protein [Clostridium sp. 'deep sea']|uniref:CpaF family protein n=1 Tax=Clostridium sp. 'deep sea' TaxID=2779445 RepID=UPI00325FDE31